MVFIQDPVAEDMVNSLKALGGVHTMDDFVETQSTFGDPLRTEYKGLEMMEHPANGQGATALLMLNMMKHFNFEKMDPMGAERAHIEAEIAKLAYGRSQPVSCRS